MRILLALLVSLTVAAPAFAVPVALKPQPRAMGPVTLGDLFDGAKGPAAKVVVGPAPSMAANAILDAGRVQLLARQAGLDWDNPAGTRRITVAAGPSAAASRRAASALVWSRNIMAGERIEAADLQWSDVAIAPQGAPADPDAAIGMVARRPLRAGSAIMASDVTAPKVIKRDDTVSVAFEQAGVTLVLQGKALADAVAGEPVEIQNLQSKKTIEALAVGPGRAVVGPRAEQLRAQSANSQGYGPFRTAFR
jgi:flagella basal body P-ring formation protein FlgA